MDTALHQKFPFILDRNLAKANCTENRVCTSCDTVVFALLLYPSLADDDVRVGQLEGGEGLEARHGVAEADGRHAGR